MANSKFAYVRSFELPDPLLPGTFILFRLDGHSFHRFSETHNFEKPNDLRALQLMDHAARSLMEEFPDICMGFGESDEYSFLLQRSTTLYNRRQAKIVSTLTSYFTSAYVFNWTKYFPDTPLQYPPSFDGRTVLYPTEQTIRDYFSWRQADTHINNMYNTVFWALVQQGGKTTTEAHATLKGTFSKEKNEILFSQFGINYSKIDERYRKGSVLFREELPESGPDPVVRMESANTDYPTVVTGEKEPGAMESLQAPSEDAIASTPSPTTTPVEEKRPTEKKSKKKASKNARPPTRVVLVHCDIIKDDFWNEHSGLLR